MGQAVNWPPVPAIWRGALQGEDVLGKIDSNGNNKHQVFLMKVLMNSLTSASWHPIEVQRNPCGERLTQDGEVPFIR